MKQDPKEQSEEPMKGLTESEIEKLELEIRVKLDHNPSVPTAHDVDKEKDK